MKKLHYIMPDHRRNISAERVFAVAKETHAMRYTPYLDPSRVSNWVITKFSAINPKKNAHLCFRSMGVFR